MDGYLLYNYTMSVKSFYDITKEILEKHHDLFQDLAKQEELDKLALSHRERDIAYHILLNEDEIMKEIIVGHNPHYKMLPSSLPDIYVSHYEERALNLIKKHLESFHLSPEESAGLKEFMKSTTGTKLLEPPNDL